MDEIKKKFLEQIKTKNIKQVFNLLVGFAKTKKDYNPCDLP